MNRPYEKSGSPIDPTTGGGATSTSTRGGRRPRAGRKAVHIDSAEIEKLCAIQCTDGELASVLGVSLRTIERRKNNAAFAEAMERGRAKGRASVRRNLWRLAQEGNVAVNIFLAKNLLGYRDYFSSEHTGPNGGPILVSDIDRLNQRRNRLAKERKEREASQAPGPEPSDCESGSENNAHES